MGKVLLWIVVILGAMMIARLLSQHNARTRTEAPPRPKNVKSPPGGAKSVESMVRCAHCGIHLPRSEALLSQGQTWCSAEHAKLGVRRQA